MTRKLDHGHTYHIIQLANTKKFKGSRTYDQQQACACWSLHHPWYNAEKHGWTQPYTYKIWIVIHYAFCHCTFAEFAAKNHFQQMAICRVGIPRNLIGRLISQAGFPFWSRHHDCSLWDNVLPLKKLSWFLMLGFMLCKTRTWSNCDQWSITYLWSVPVICKDQLSK